MLKNISELIDDLILAATVKETYSRWNGEPESGYPRLAEARKALEDAIAEILKNKKE